MVLTVSFVVSLVIGLSCHHPRCAAQAASPGWYQRRDIRTPRLRRPRRAHSSRAPTRPPHLPPHV